MEMISMTIDKGAAEFIAPPSTPAAPTFAGECDGEDAAGEVEDVVFDTDDDDDDGEMAPVRDLRERRACSADARHVAAVLFALSLVLALVLHPGSAARSKQRSYVPSDVPGDDVDVDFNDGSSIISKTATVPDDVVDDSTDLGFVPFTTDERFHYKEMLRRKLQPRPWNISTAPYQFMHMHHMKTGGTSVDTLLRCAMSRQERVTSTKVPYYRMSECSRMVQRCMNKLFDPNQENCPTDSSAVMSYCASLHSVRMFQWGGVDKITVIRDPVDRVWSMYRFTLKRCYQCEPLHVVLEKILNGTFVSGSPRNKPHAPHPGDDEHHVHHGDDGDGGGGSSNGSGGDGAVTSYDDTCAVQMIGHQATNLLSSEDLYDVANDVTFPREEDITQEAVFNLRSQFTVVGVTDRIQESVDMFGTVFPFLAQNLSVSSGGEVESDPKGCKLEHRNAGKDPACGTKELDDYTIGLIEKLNRRDVEVYKAAVEIWDLQREVLDEMGYHLQSEGGDSRR